MSGTAHQPIGTPFAYDWNLPAAVGSVLTDRHAPGSFAL
jgi:hypothetical protein